MKKPILFIFFSFCALILHAQDYLINFSGTGSSTTVETVTVENLTQGKSITFSGSKTLHLMSAVTGNTPLLEYMDYPMIVYPNPSPGDFTVQFDSQKSGMVTVAIYDISGREINKLQQRIQNGFQSFKVAGLSNGVYTIQVLLEDQKFTQKVICNGKSNSMASISYNGFSEAKQKETTLKNATIEQAWQYNTGDRLKFQGTSGKYSTIVMDVPAQSKTLSFDFVECSDADGNNYPIVKIGNQLWMAENLKTTKYNDGAPIPNERDNANWMNLSSGAYCWYNNDVSNKNIYGSLYNWYAVNTQKLSPSGWHVPSDEEWAILTNYLGGIETAGGKLKETGQIHWLSPNKGATNETGFTALPAGYRNTSGNFEYMKHATNIWSSTIYPYWNAALDRVLASDISSVYIGNPPNRKEGKSVRCLYNISAPLIKTKKIVSINTYSAEIECELINDGGGQLLKKGICWSRTPNPDVFDSMTISDSEINIFNCKLSELQASNKYYVKAFAINSAGISYGEELTFTTLDYPLKGIKIVVNNTIIKPWQELQMEAFVFDEKGNTFPTRNCKWSSNNKTIASINNEGKIIGNQLGRVKIYAKTDAFTDSVEIKVDIDNYYLVSENIILDSVGSWAETSVAVNPKNPLNIVASANFANFSSFDGGRTWNRASSSLPASADPNVGFLDNGTMLRQGLGWDSSLNGRRGIVVQRSGDGGLSLPADQVFWAYMPVTEGSGNADQGIMCTDIASDSPYKGSVYVICSDYPANNPSYKKIGFSLLVLISRDGGKTWLDPIDISTAPDGGQESSSYITTGHDGKVYAAWWNLSNQVVFSKSTDGGLTWSKEKIVHKNEKVNNFQLTADVRGNITVKVDQGDSQYKDNIYISAIDYNGISGGAADAWIINSSNDGETWSDIVLLSDGLRGAFKYYFQPRISVAPNGRIDAVWYDTRNWRGTNTMEVDYDLYYAYSLDGGNSFSQNIRVSPLVSTKKINSSQSDQRVLYEYIGLTSDNHRVMPVWTTILNGRATPAFSTIWIK